jgi:aspartyl protease family protein
MGMSSGPQRAIAEAISWASAGALILVGIIYQNEIRGGLGLRFEPSLPAGQQPATPARTPTEHGVPAKSETETPERKFGRDIVRLRADARGHFNTQAYINGSAIEVLVDTGATTVALTWEDAQAAGIRVSESDFTAQSRTANGIATFAPVTIGRLSIGDIELTRVQGHVARRGQLSTTLLGMSFLGKISVEMKDRELVLTQ